MNLSKHDNFFDSVYQVVRLIPHGRVTSYGDIARYLGAAKSSRMVGWAMNGSHTQTLYVPAHRVVNSAGLLTGKHFFASPTAMEELLQQENVLVKNNKVVDFKIKFWNPVTELSL
jgi:methylated-DNA-protein-cysteine methyltransferase related protein